MPETLRRRPGLLWGAGIVLLAVAARAWAGVLVPVDADQATLGLESLLALHGRPVLMELNGRYLGGLEGMYVAPFIGVFGPTKLALRLPMILVGAAYALVLYQLARRVLPGRAWPVLMAAVGAVLPAYLTVYTVKPLGGHSEVPLFEALCLLLAIRVAWPRAGSPQWWEWALLGFTSGVGLWSDPSLVVVLPPIAACVLLRAPTLGWKRFTAGAAQATAAALVGFGPWLLFNLRNHWAALHALTRTHPHTFSGAPDAGALALQLAAFAGARVNCTPLIDGWGPPLAVVALLAAATVLYLPGTLRAPAGRPSALAPGTMVLATGWATLAVAWAGAGDIPACDARLLVPFATPAVFAMLALAAQPVPLRLLGLVAVGCALVLAGWSMLQPPGDHTTTEQVALAARLRGSANPVEAYYWVGRPVMYFSGGQVSVAEYGGLETFPDVQAAAAAAPRPDWIFAVDDPDLSGMTRYTASHRITFRREQFGGLVLMTSFSAGVHPGDFPLAPRSLGLR